MLGPAEREHARHRLVRHSRRRDHLADLQILVLRRPADARHHLGRVPVDVLAQQVDDATRVLPGIVYLGKTLLLAFIIPARFIVAPAFLVIAAEQPVYEAELLLHDKPPFGIAPPET